MLDHIPHDGITSTPRCSRRHTNAVTSVAISSSRRRIYSGSLDSTLKVWALDYPINANGIADEQEVGGEAAQGEPLASVDTGSEIVTLSVLPCPGAADAVGDVILASASADGCVKLYRCSGADGDEPVLLRSFD